MRHPGGSENMSREFDIKAFDRLYDLAVVRGRFNEDADCYPPYRARYREILRKNAEAAGRAPGRVLHIGRGQHALLAKLLWGDRTTLADIAGSHFDYLRQQGVEVVRVEFCHLPHTIKAFHTRVLSWFVIHCCSCPGFVTT
jgi:hypothetical protein